PSPKTFLMRKVRIITNPERIAPLQPGFTFARYFASDSAGSFWEDDPCQFGRPGPGRPGWLPTQVSGKEVTSPPPPPLRTARESFPSCSSRLSNALCRTRLSHI